MAMSLRTRRNLLRGALFVLGLGLIVFGVLVPVSIELRVLAVILGLLVYQTVLLNLFDRLLPNERRYLPLREETDRLLELVRDLNQAALAAKAIGMDRDRYVDPIVRQMHETVDRLPIVAAERVRHAPFRPWLKADEGEEAAENRLH